MAITEHKQRPRILVAGCGKLGGAIAETLSRDAEVFGLRRNPDRIPEGIHALGADLLDREQVESVLPDNLDIVIYCLTPSSYDEEATITPMSVALRIWSRRSVHRPSSA